MNLTLRYFISVVIFFLAIGDICMAQQTDRSGKLPKKCGLVTTGDKITNGMNATVGQFPFMALLGYSKNVLNVNLEQFVCGGSIINEEYILTAAHCFKTTLTFVRLGELDLNSNTDCVNVADTEVCGDPIVDIPIKEKIIHREYNRRNFKNDIALVKLERKIQFTDYIQPICLPLDTRHDNLIKSGLIVSGWGKTTTSAASGSSILQFAFIHAWQTKECENVLEPEVRPLGDTQMCGNGLKGQDACRGDSGGPLFAVEAVDFVATYFQVGVVSFGAAGACGNRELPSVYTRTDQYVPWIIENI